MNEILDRIIRVLAIVALTLMIVYLVSRILRVARGGNAAPKGEDHSPSTSTGISSQTPKACFSNFIEDGDDRQTAFYKDSTNYALRVVSGQEEISTDGMSDDSKQTLYFVDRQEGEERAKIYEEIKSMFNKEEDMDGYFRRLNASYEVPMWMLIIRQAMSNISNTHFAR